MRIQPFLFRNVSLPLSLSLKSKIVGNLAPEMTSDTLQTIFEAFGQVVECSVPPDPMKGGHRGYGFIAYADPQHAKVWFGFHPRHRLNSYLEVFFSCHSLFVCSLALSFARSHTTVHRHTNNPLYPLSTPCSDF
jgi:hypothetical protein